MARKGKQMRYCEPVMLLRMVRLVAQITSPTTHLVIGKALSGLTTHVRGSFRADLQVVVLATTIRASLQ